MDAIRTVHLTKRYGGTTTVDDENLVVEQGGQLRAARRERRRQDDDDIDAHRTDAPHERVRIRARQIRTHRRRVDQ